jgi:hypothetical protein
LKSKPKIETIPIHFSKLKLENARIEIHPQKVHTWHVEANVNTQEKPKQSKH